MKWFGYLHPLEFKKCQNNFKNVIVKLIDLSNIRLKLIDLIKEYENFKF